MVQVGGLPHPWVGPLDLTQPWNGCEGPVGRHTEPTRNTDADASDGTHEVVVTQGAGVPRGRQSEVRPILGLRVVSDTRRQRTHTRRLSLPLVAPTPTRSRQMSHRGPGLFPPWDGEGSGVVGPETTLHPKRVGMGGHFHSTTGRQTFCDTRRSPTLPSFHPSPRVQRDRS